MIGWLNGTLREKRPPQLLLDVGGVGYEIDAPMTTFYELPESGQDVALFIHQIVRDDSINLYGFAHAQERDVFRLLLRVNGVGAKVGLAILSGMDSRALARCVSRGDTAGLSKIPGIGKKTAERLVIELRDRLGPVAPATPGGLEPDAASSPASFSRPADPADEAVAALIALGFKAPEATQRIQAVESPGLICEDLVRLALQSVAR
ncbi:MAG: Holliday junction DNA helicase RuvA [Gammaproteobacteria bacterium]|jgi:Holliday junction DNA helicase RuvA